MPMKPRPPLILAYHGVSDVSPKQDRRLLFVRPSDLVRHIGWLRRWQYRLVTFGELERRVREDAADGLAALTFDDGFLDNLTVLAPLLGSLQAPATAFVVSGWLDQRHPDAPWARIINSRELRSLAAAGIEIGGHSSHHEDLSQLEYIDAARDMRACRETLEDMLDRPVELFAYPFGEATRETMAACQAAGFRAACSAAGRGSWDEPFNLPRQSMVNGATTLGLWLKRDARYEPLMRTALGAASRRIARSARRLVT